MDYFYDGQFKNVLSQFTRIFSNFKYKTGVNHTGTQELLPIPCRVGHISRMVGAIQTKGSENVALTAPFISCWISNISVARDRTRNPTYVDQMSVTEREFDYSTNTYKEGPGNSYQVERLAPVAYDISMQVDIWSTNEEMKLQVLEQILILFNPSIDFQKNENPLDWSALGIIELDSINYSSRSVPVGNDDAVEVTSLTFQVQHFYLNPPAKVKKQKLITNIYQNIYASSTDLQTWDNSYLFTDATTYKNAQLRIVGDEATLVSSDNSATWDELLFNLGIKKENDGFYKIRLESSHPNINAPILINIDDFSEANAAKILVSVNENTLPSPTITNAVDAFIDPNVLYPDNGLDTAIGKRYIITRDIIPNTEAWGTTNASAGSIITTTDGVNFIIDFNSKVEDTGSIIRNLDDDELYVHVDEDLWVNVYQGTYRAGYWRLVSEINDNKSV